MTRVRAWGNPGMFAAIGAAVLFGAGTPLAKLLLVPVDPWLLAGILYLGSGLGLALLRVVRRPQPVGLDLPHAVLEPQLRHPDAAVDGP